MMSHPKRIKKEVIPSRLNVLISLGAIAAALSLLWYASHTHFGLGFILAIIAFSFVNNTIFSLLHEAVHGIYHENRHLNEWAGRLLAAFFPTGFNFQRIAHLGHHRRNRTDAEIFDYYKPGDNLLVKYAQWYGILTGLYWLLPPLSSLVFLLCPTSLLKWAIDRSERSHLAYQTSADGMLSGFKNAPFTKIKLEIIFSILFQIALIYLLDLNWLGWLGCYVAFGFNWSSLQYTDHAFSELDVHDGAWNLRINRLVRSIFLNYHHHRAHHQFPHVPWLHLGRYVDEAEEQPSFLSIYLKMWLGPRPYPETVSIETGSSRPEQMTIQEQAIG
jgi:fatty acid desaturase